MTLDTGVFILSTLTLIGQLIALDSIVSLLIGKKWGINRHVAKHGLILMLIVALTATLGSLYLSELVGWVPCRLCWYQRIFMYPQVVLLIIAIWKKDRSIAKYILALSAIGLAIALYHYYGHIMDKLFPGVVDPELPCDESGVSCRFTPFFHLGYITIPLMAGTAFLLNILGSLLIIRKK